VLGQATEYAVAALAFLGSRNGAPILVREIAESTSVPGPYLAKIVNVLAHRHLVSTRRGPGGGVSLARAPHQISLFDVCRALDDPLTEDRCMLSHQACSTERSCPAHTFCRTYRTEQFAFLQRTTLVDIMEFDARRRGDDISAAEV
jgi:Rrf2 family transcriptional regulator, iron-sulfur cluster assembly transcription factor